MNGECINAIYHAVERRRYTLKALSGRWRRECNNTHHYRDVYTNNDEDSISGDG